MNPFLFHWRTLTLCAFSALVLLNPAHAQPAAPAPATPSAAPTDNPDAPADATRRARRAAPTPQKVDQVEITGKNSATEERRNSTAAKIIITREDIEQYGDTNLGDVMRRLPGVTTGGRPGRTGAPRMRGMGGGYTQILIDGQRIPPGFNIEEITPEQVERIEIYRAPTAETGARAIAGTINIILREPLRSTNNDIRLGLQSERGKLSDHASWTGNGILSETGTYNITASANKTQHLTDTASHTIYSDAVTGVTQLEQTGFSRAEDSRENLFLSGRALWRLGVGEQFGVQAFVAHNTSDGRSAGTLTQLSGSEPAPYATRAGASNSANDVVRLNVNLNKRIDSEIRYEVRVSGGTFSSTSHGASLQFADTGEQTLLQMTDGRIHDRSWNSAGKLVRNVVFGGQAITAGYELEGLRRSETSVTVLNGTQQLADLGTEFVVSTQRNAIYLQDEWDPAPNWSANVGVRYETIETKSSVAGDTYSNTSRVLSPLAHVVWRFAAPARDQLRLSLTHSYLSPTVGQLSARPSLNTLFPVPGANTAVSPDRAGNPNLKPQLANGIDLAYERYFDSGGMVSVNLFQRDIDQFIRNVTAAENVSWANAPRYVSRPQNLGKAMTRGVEFDGKFQLKEVMTTTLPLSLRVNLSVFDSKVDAVPGPYNRIDQQPRATANLGFEYRFVAAPLRIGGNFGWTPAYSTQLTETQGQKISTKRVFDAYGLWTINPTAKLRLSLSNIAPIDYVSQTSVVDAGLRQVVISTGRTDMSVALRLELHL